ncbi:unnamed protein product [Macrosiphum euphorbiae]|uniref:Endonuclease/exonuclease/phosphatase domain-containing protein n=1 Tax=Macrosiphum euphorbiae TaxID=13131 RepID=A0AAV0X2K7_9HEMI|nr:unnamed protein product [Macrosiphum euphorbiae]
MIITNTRSQNPKRRIYTWKMPGDIARYQIDYILVKNRFKNQVKFCKTYPSADCDSDHNIVIAKCELRYKKPQRTKVKQDNYTVRLLKSAEVVEEYGRYMDIEYQKQNVDDPLNKKWENIKSAIKKVADSVLIKKEKREPRRAWIYKEIVKLIDERRKYKNNNTREGHQKYRQLRGMRLIEKPEKQKKNGWSSSVAKLTKCSKLTK